MMERLDYLPTLTSLLVSPNIPILHRDLSWLQFNERVLDEARTLENPALERLKFVGITASNLDEFFSIRFASQTRLRSKKSRVFSQDVPTTVERIYEITASILESVQRFITRQTETFEVIAADLEEYGIYFIRDLDKNAPYHSIAKKIFDKKVLPLLAPAEKFKISHLRKMKNLEMAAIFEDREWIRIANNIPLGFVQKTKGSVLVFFLDDLLLQFLPKHAGYSTSPALLRMTRDGDFNVDFENKGAELVPDLIESFVNRREKGRPLRVQYVGAVTEEFLHQCAKTLKLEPLQLFQAGTTLSLSAGLSIANQIGDYRRNHRSLIYPKVKAYLPQTISKGNLFDTLQKKDILLHHPYDSFDGFTEFIKAACEDPNVVIIEQTIYRVDVGSAFIELLKKAAQTKRVRLVIEARARFDELPNLKLAEELQESGVEVAFGFGKLKLHAKIALVTRNEEGVPKYYTHLSTGNYNSKTAKIYTDLSVLTSNDDIGHDARYFFDHVFERTVPKRFKTLLSAPLGMHRKLIQLIREETKSARAGKSARIIAKVNALVDTQVTKALYDASQAGVQVDLIVRGACSLIPGVKGLSENIRVISIVDRFLEHSRIYYFGNAQTLYLSSADWMPRNFFTRLELAFPTTDERVYNYLTQVLLPCYLADTKKSRELTPQGTWKRRTNFTPNDETLPILSLNKNHRVRSQFLFIELAQKKYRNTPIY